MKKLVSITFLMLLQIVSAQEISKALGDFSTVKVFDKINVKLVKANENKIVITGSKANDVELVTKGDDVKIRMKLSKLLQGEDITATLYYKKIDEIEASEGSYVSSEDNFKEVSFELNAKEGAKIKLNLEVQKLKSKMHSGGEIEITGSAASHDVTITSGGILKARKLVTAQTEVGISAGGNANINATDLVDAKVRAGGDIDVYGNPKQVLKKITAGGNVTTIDQ